jgi:hypothetical protein
MSCKKQGLQQTSSQQKPAKGNKWNWKNTVHFTILKERQERKKSTYGFEANWD